MFEIGNLKLESRVILAPMAGITDLPFRMLNRRFGCELAFIEMLNAHSISFKSPKTRQMMLSKAKDKPLGAQLLGKEQKYILRALEVLNNYKLDILDFNAACPAKKVVRRGEGASLMKEPKKLAALLKLLVDNLKLPVTVKIRTGWDKSQLNAKDAALAAQDAGVKAVFIHGRTREQEYSAGVDYNCIRQVKRALKIPVIASGDVLFPELAKKMFDETGCDAILVARGALGNPWIFKQIEEFFKDGEIKAYPCRDELIRVMLEHLEANIEFYGERNGVMIFRKFFAWYTKGLRRIRLLREKSSRAKTKAEMAAIIEGCRRL